MLTAGTRLGVYEITAPLGAGGMGEVYRARDTRLQRDVALKILPDLFAVDPDRLARFEREAQLLAALNHPHIAAIYGVEESTDVRALVMELVEGPTLADLIAAGPVPLAEVRGIATQIAQALEAAHEQGIVHRDLKPANIKVRADGTVKVLDFGLAKAIEGSAALATHASLPPTVTSPAFTAAGVIFGTAAYMSPEQARGKLVDRRTDIWAFGCVLFEMLTGTRAFGGDEITDTLAAVLTRDPDWSRLPPETPVSLRRMLRRALVKEKTHRLADAGDARLDLEDALTPAESPDSARPAPRAARWRTLAAACTAAVGASIVGGLVVANWREAPALEGGPVRFHVAPPEGWAFPVGQVEAAAAPLAVSPDGERLAFVAQDAQGRSQIWVRPLGAVDATPIAGTEGGHSPFWSPDGRAIAFFADGRLKRVDVDGGAVLALTTVNGRGGAWGADGVILINPAINSPLIKVPASGGTPQPATTLVDGDGDHRQPSFLPDGRRFIYEAAAGGVGTVYAASLDAPGRTMLLKVDSSDVVYSAGHLLFLRGTTLMAQRLDLDRLQVTGDAFPVAEQIQTTRPGGPGGLPYGLFSAAANGVLVYRSGTSRIASELQWFNRAGQPLGSIGGAARFADISLSPDGRRAVVVIIGEDTTTQEPGRDIWVVDLKDGGRTRLTFNPSAEWSPVWSPDSETIAFGLTPGTSAADVYRKPASGAAPETLLYADRLLKIPTSWSPDGRWLLYHSGIEGANRTNQLFLLPVTPDAATGRPTPFLPASTSKRHAQFSPDGRWVAYVGFESDALQVYVTSFPTPSGKWQVSTDRGDFPRWSSRGTELFYLGAGGVLMAASVDGTGPSFVARSPRPVLQADAISGGGFPYDVSADGQRILVNVLPQTSASSPITVVVNWASQLDR
jgi:Tol biopolymer transport system component